MKYLMIVLSVFFTLNLLGQTLNVEEVYQNIQHVYEQKNEVKEGYISFTSQVVHDENEGEILSNNIWFNSQRTKYVNGYMTMLQDQQYHAMILTDSRRIILKNIEEKDRNVFFSSQQQLSPYDTLVKYKSSLTAIVDGEGNHRFTIQFTDDYVKKYKQSRIEIVYNPEIKDIQRVLYTHCSQGHCEISIYTYLELRPKLLANELTQSVEESLFVNGQLKTIYQDYYLIDLRQ